MYDAVIFDFDNTLVDYVWCDTNAIKHVWRGTYQDIDFEEFMDQSVESLYKIYEENDSDENIHENRLQRTMKHFNIKWDNEYLDRYFAKYLKEYHLFNGVIDLLEKLHMTTKLSILTNAPDIMEQKRRIEISGIGAYIKSIHIAGEIGHYKPEREAFLFAADSRGVSPDTCLFVGDSEQYDIQGARNAGMRTAKRLTEYSNKTSSADFVFSNFADLKRFIFD